MEFNVQSVQTYCLVGLISVTAACLRYLLMTGTYYIIVCQLFDRKFRKYKINPDRVSGGVVQKEMSWALLNNLNYAILATATYGLYERGWLKLYFDWHEYGTLYGLLVILVLLLAHDAYFFWAHYLMHREPFRRISHHWVHHQFHNVTPWSAFSVHPIEGFVELLFRPVLLMLIPTHPYTLVAFAILSFGLNIIGHSGYEFFPKNFATSPLTKFSSCATYHYLHHRNSNCNFALFFNFWDRIMGSMAPDYASFYAATRGRVDSADRAESYSAKAASRGFASRER
ncbi:sterol desaturase family protein [Bythopirellula polymerisocia]|uniref:sterol desaturase family protein n=1 Tax=Bythopirellula polymerisocia TaxID=2528003 RepID=UPI0011B5B148|nr:sterol desaturase family protein [Bythopirellula polymerisocia]